MRLHLLHGPASWASRKYLMDFKKKFDQNSVVSFESGKSVEEVLGNLMTQPLLENGRLTIWENPDENLSSDLSLITYHLSLILWFDHEIKSKSLLDWVKKIGGKILFFPESKEISVFPFLDLLAAGDKKAYLEMGKLKEEGFDIHYLIVMTYYLLRNLVVTPTSAPDFVKRKFLKQREKFSLEQIKNLYRNILDMEFKLKSGLLEISQAEFLLVSQFLTN